MHISLRRGRTAIPGRLRYNIISTRRARPPGLRTFIHFSEIQEESHRLSSAERLSRPRVRACNILLDAPPNEMVTYIKEHYRVPTIR